MVSSGVAVATSSASWKSPARGNRSGSSKKVVGGPDATSSTTTNASSAHTVNPTDGGVRTIRVVASGDRSATTIASSSSATPGWQTTVISVDAGSVRRRSP